jgi:hypothetical protein
MRPGCRVRELISTACGASNSRSLSLSFTADPMPCRSHFATDFLIERL